MNERETVQQALNKARRVLNVLELRSSGYTSLSIPAELQIELEDQRQKVAEYQKRLDELSPKPLNIPSLSLSPTNASRPHTARENHFNELLNFILKGKLVIFLGTELNLLGRTPNQWVPGKHLPTNRELAKYLAQNFSYPTSDVTDLTAVSQHLTVFNGSGALYDELHTLFNVDYPPGFAQSFFASLPSILKEKGYSPRPLLFVTASYDDTLERAFRAEGVEFDLVSYIADGEDRGKFLHWLEGREENLVIERPNEYEAISLEERCVILKIHGMVDRSNSDRDSYVITEDHSINFLARSEISNLIPYSLVARLRKSSYLFLGYNLRDWSLRVILNRLWSENKLSYKSWAVELNPEELDRKFWARREVDMRDERLEQYIADFAEWLEKLPEVGGEA